MCKIQILIFMRGKLGIVSFRLHHHKWHSCKIQIKKAHRKCRRIFRLGENQEMRCENLGWIWLRSRLLRRMALMRLRVKQLHSRIFIMLLLNQVKCKVRLQNLKLRMHWFKRNHHWTISKFQWSNHQTMQSSWIFKKCWLNMKLILIRWLQLLLQI